MSPGTRTLADVTVDPEYAVVSERRGTVSLIVVRHRVSCTFWSCSYVYRSDGSGWFESQRWFPVEVSTDIVDAACVAENVLAERRDLVHAIAGIMESAHRGDRFMAAEKMVDPIWQMVIRKMIHEWNLTAELGELLR